MKIFFFHFYYERQWNYHLQSIYRAKDEQIVQLSFSFDLFCRGLIISGLMFGDQPNSIKGVLANNRNCSESRSQIEMAVILWAGKLLDYQNAPDLTLTSIKSSECNCLARDLSQVTAFEMDFRICETRTQEEKRPQKINLKKKKEKTPKVTVTPFDKGRAWCVEKLYGS